MLIKVKNILSSRAVLIIIIIFFLLQSAWYASSIRYNIPPDESYHSHFIDYYSDRSIFAGPVINDQNSNFTLGDIERTPNYLYHYTLSFPLKFIKLFTANQGVQIFILRLINIGFMVIGLAVLLKIFTLAKLSKMQSNIVLLMLCLTGMFVWISAAINYDNLALPLFWISIYTFLLLVKNLKTKYLVAFGLFAVATVLVKTTFAPILLILTAIVLAYKFSYIWNMKFHIVAKNLRQEFNKRNYALWFLLLIFVIVGGLFIERFGVNAIKYQSITPYCTKLHTEQQCLENSVYKRNNNQQKIAAGLKQTDNSPVIIPTLFTSNWLDLMYGRIFFYTGSKQIQPSVSANLVATITFFFILIIISLKKSKLLKSDEQKLILLITVMYILILFLFNLKAYMDTAAMFGYQGRYLLPVVPFVYVFLVLLISNVYRSSSKDIRKILITLVILLTALNIFHHAPPLVFLRSTDDSWYTPRTKGFNHSTTNILHKIRLINKNQLKYTD